MVNEEEGKKIKTEADEIANELYAVFEDHFTKVMCENNVRNMVTNVVQKTLICKANRDNPNYPEKIKEKEEL